LNVTFESIWILNNGKKRNEFILKYYQNSLQFENAINKIFMLENKFMKNEVMFDNLEEMSNLLDLKTIELKKIYDEFNKLSFSKNLIRLKMLKAKYLIDNSYLNINSLNDLMGIVKYKSKSAFINNFKKITGYSPVAYSKIKKDIL
jgi:YesN/AraC family two-component response regulator